MNPSELLSPGPEWRVHLEVQIPLRFREEVFALEGELCLMRVQPPDITLSFHSSSSWKEKIGTQQR